MSTRILIHHYMNPITNMVEQRNPHAGQGPYCIDVKIEPTSFQDIQGLIQTCALHLGGTGHALKEIRYQKGEVLGASIQDDSNADKLWFPYGLCPYFGEVAWFSKRPGELPNTLAPGRYVAQISSLEGHSILAAMEVLPSLRT